MYDADDMDNLHNLSKHDFVGSYEFTLGKVVSGRNQEIEGPLTGGPRNTGAKVKIMATELKNNYDSETCTFSTEYLCSESDHIFLVFNKFKSPGNYQPIYKTECKLPSMKMYSFNATTIGTDTMFGGHDDQECLIQVFRF